MAIANNSVSFIPVRTTEDRLEAMDIQNGYLYFTVDSNKIYLGMPNGEKLSMGGNTGIFYGKKEINYPTDGTSPDPNVIFSLSDIADQSDIEGSRLPQPNDLILNIDGCFYRVINIIDDNSVFTNRITLQGTGGGGGIVGPGGGSSSGYSIGLTSTRIILSSQEEAINVEFFGTAYQEIETYITRVSFTLNGAESDENTPFLYEEGKYEIGTISNPKKYKIDLINHKDLFGSNPVKVWLNTTDIYGTQYSKEFTVQLIDLTLTKSVDTILKSLEDDYSYVCSIGGAKTGISDKKLEVSIYTEENLNTPINKQTINIENNFNGDKTCSIKLSSLEHGVYVLSVQLSAKLLGTNRIIYSNTLTHKIIRFVEGSTNTLLATYMPEKAEQYVNVPVEFMVASSEENKDYTVNISIDGIEKINLISTTNTLKSYNLNFEKQGVYGVSFTVVELSNLVKKHSIQIVEYTGNLPIINPLDPNLMLYLTPKGRSNDAADRDTWNDYNNKYSAKLNNVFYSSNSGWLEENGLSYLLLTSGGTVTVPGFYPFQYDPTQFTGQNSAMGKGMTIELDFEIDGITDYNAEIIKCISKNQNNDIRVGFSIVGNKAYLYNSSKNGGTSGSLANMNLVEGKRIRLSFVIEPNNDKYPYPMCLTYLDGKISNAAIYSKSDTFIESSDGRAELIIDSRYAQIKIYGIRFYSNALKDNEILNNYTASFESIQERQKTFDSNNVYDNFGEINYEDVSAELYDLQIPYMTIVGGWACDPDDKWKLLSKDKVGEAALPTGKKDYRMIDVSVVYPKIDYFKDHKNYSYKNIFNNGLGMTDNFGNSPSDKTGCIMYAQGTSSMEYPVKNLRLRFRKEKDYFTVFPDIAPVEIICMKADYMESSGSHNTGAANLVDDLYSRASLKTPGQQHFGPNEENPDRKDIVTCIKGHPCLIFWSPNGEKGSFKYIGKYNLNLDKATPEPFGFNHDDSDFGYLKPGDTYYAIDYDDDGKKFIGQKNPSDGGDYADTKDGEELMEVAEGEKINSIHCFEFLDNAVPVCNFLERPKAYIKDEAGNLLPDPDGDYYTYKETWYNEFDAGEGKTAPGWTFGFESRYPEDRVGYHDADMLYPFASWLSELYYLKTSGEEGEKEANARFKNEYQGYLNKEFLLFYYIVTEALLMADSRVKNMMIATWGKEDAFHYYPLTYAENEKYVYAGIGSILDWDSGKDYYKLISDEYILVSSYDEEDENTSFYTKTIEKSWTPDKTQPEQIIESYKWYPIFYDMDTMLGLDNTGVKRFNYYDEDYDPSIYNGDEVLWNFVRDCLPLELDEMYNRLEPAGLNIDLSESGLYKGTSLIPYFNNNQANMANEAFYNGDAQYKYIRPAISGYWDGLNNVKIEAGEAPYLYAAQGDRALDRENFIVNRTKFLRGKHGSEDFQTNDRITFRLYHPTGKEANFKEGDIDHSNSITSVPPSDTFTFGSLQTCYAGVLIGANGRVVKERFDGEQTKDIIVPEAQSANGTEAYLLGVSNLKDLGDLSNKYPQKFIISGKNKLRSLALGNAHKDYYNPFWRPEGGNSTPVGLSGCTYLQEFNLLNCKTYNAELDFTGCPIIETILLTGSSTSNVKLPINGMLKELRLPTTVYKLTIDTHQGLTKDKFSIGTYNYGSDNLIGGNGNYVNDYLYLTDLTIINTPIDTYDMVSKASNLEGYYFEGFNWEIEGNENDNQYLSINQSEDWNENKEYYIWDVDNKVYVRANQTDFNNNKQRIKEKVKLINNDAITKIPILEYLLQKAPRKNQQPVTKESALTGTITIKAQAKVNEFDLYQKYKKIYPGVNIAYDEEAIGSDNLTKAYKIEFFNTADIDGNTEPYYSVLTNGTYSLQWLTSKEGPNGVNIVNPTKFPTNTETFEFSGKWKVYASTDDNYPVDFEISENDFNIIEINGDVKLIPEFNSSTRKYKIVLCDYDKKELLNKELEYGADIGDSLKDDICSYYNYREYNGSKEHFRYEFKGWQSEYNYLNEIDEFTYSVLDGINVNGDLRLYAYYKEEDCLTNASNENFFEFDDKTLIFKEKYVPLLQGKITLPSINDKGEKLTRVKRFIEANGGPHLSQVTHIYCLQDAAYQTIEKYTFTSAGSLEYTQLLELDSLETIGIRAFANNEKLTLTSLPKNLKTVGTAGFAACTLISIESFIAQNNELTFDGQAFSGAGKNVNNITIGSNSVNNKKLIIGDDAFKNYGLKEAIVTIYWNGIDRGKSSQIDNKFGLSQSNITEIGE